MKILLQRVGRASVRVGEELVGEIGEGLLVFVGVEKQDDRASAAAQAARTAHLRVFPDAADPEGRMNRSLLDTGGSALVVSQFTLAASTKRGRRPSFDTAAEPEPARALFEEYVRALTTEGVAVRTGRFGARMQVELLNDGPVTFLLE